ncbi:MAG: ABC transporter ATP-binding protein [Nitrosospira sp.]
MFSENKNIARRGSLGFPSGTGQGEKSCIDKTAAMNNEDVAIAAMNNEDVAICAQNLSKCYQIYDKPHDRLKQSLYPRIQRFIGSSPKQYFREFWALKDVSFEVKKGETVGIIGRNGSGKSTLLQIICGTLASTGGHVETKGRIAALLELGSGFNPEFSGRENVYMNAAVLGLNSTEVDEKFDDIAAFADIGQFIEQPVKTYSSGMFVRLAFAVNIVSDPKIMIVDEALAVGDMNFQAKCMTALTRIQERGATVLFVSHEMGALKSLCSRGIYLERGMVQAIGPAGAIAEQYIRKMREEMNAEHSFARPAADTRAGATIPLKNQGLADPQEFKTSTQFEKRVANFRYGDGGAKITFAELLDVNFCSISNVEFNQVVFVRVYFETSIDDEVSCNYYVLDDKRNLILGAGLTLANQSLMRVKNGGRYIVIYKTRLPLHEGNHSIQLQITKRVVQDQAAKFLDVIDDALVFTMSRREGARIWTKAFIENEVEIKSCCQE